MAYIKEIIDILKYGLADIKKRFIITKYPIELQFPVTYKCNFNCVMCGMRTLIGKPHCEVSEIGRILSDKLFKEIKSVGINGGEPFLRKDLVELVKTITEKLPKLKGISIISNGCFTNTIASELPKIRAICKERGVKLYLSLSVDGTGEMQDFMRGSRYAFRNVNATIDVIKSDIDRFCDSLNIICTITKYNVFNLFEVYNWSKDRQLNISFNLATVNKRINNDDMVEDFSIFFDEEARFMAQEFFYRLYRETGEKRYFALFEFVKDRKRADGCPYMYNNGVTLTPDGHLSYCATHSDIIGNCLEKSAYEVYRDNQEYHKTIREEFCRTCSHYISGLNGEGCRLLHKEHNRYRYLNSLKKKEANK